MVYCLLIVDCCSSVVVCWLMCCSWCFVFGALRFGVGCWVCWIWYSFFCCIVRCSSFVARRLPYCLSWLFRFECSLMCVDLYTWFGCLRGVCSLLFVVRGALCVVLCRCYFFLFLFVVCYVLCVVSCLVVVEC